MEVLAVGGEVLEPEAVCDAQDDEARGQHHEQPGRGAPLRVRILAVLVLAAAAQQHAPVEAGQRTVSAVHVYNRPIDSIAMDRTGW